MEHQQRDMLEEISYLGMGVSETLAEEVAENVSNLNRTGTRYIVMIDESGMGDSPERDLQ